MTPYNPNGKMECRKRLASTMACERAVVTKEVHSRALVIGNPAKIVGWVNTDGSKMKDVGPNKFLDNEGNYWTEHKLGIQRM
jgi:hypothetical protein